MREPQLDDYRDRYAHCPSIEAASGMLRDYTRDLIAYLRSEIALLRSGRTASTPTFTFRDVVRALGIPPSNETHWSVGQMLRDLAARQGIEPERLLTEKTDPTPTVDAPHCIAHYPMRLYASAIAEINAWWGDRTRQLDMFPPAQGDRP